MSSAFLHDKGLDKDGQGTSGYTGFKDTIVAQCLIRAVSNHFELQFSCSTDVSHLANPVSA